MLHPEMKRQRLEVEGSRCNNDEAAADNNDLASIERLSGDVLANILGFLLPRDIMNARLNNKMREAAKITIVPLTDFIVDSVKRYNAMRVMATALPNLQRIELCHLGDEHKYVEGEDPDEDEAARTADLTSHDIEIISNFTKLRELKIERFVPTYQSLNGRYPCLFNFPHLQILSIGHFDIHIQFDLEMLSGLPSLKELKCAYIDRLTGNLNSLRVIKGTLEKVTIDSCRKVEGNFMDLADIPHLEVLDLRYTAVTGDIRDIGENNFPSLTVLALPAGVYGGIGHEFQRISDAQDVARIPYLFQKQRPEIVLKDWHAILSDDSPDSYDVEGYDIEFTPVFIRLAKAGNRVGYQWSSNFDGYGCEVNWLDPEPDRESTGYGKYMEDLQKIEEQIDYFKGFHQPPTQEEFESILERIHEDIDDGFAMSSEFDSDSDSGDDEMEDN